MSVDTRDPETSDNPKLHELLAKIREDGKRVRELLAEKRVTATNPFDDIGLLTVLNRRNKWRRFPVKR